MNTRLIIIELAVVLTVGCANPGMVQFSPNTYSTMDPAQTAGTPDYSQPDPNPVEPAYAATKLMLFGGEDHKIYLGCISCNKYTIDSVFNEFGNSGSKFSSTSIWNQFGQYGSQFSIYSPWNQFATDPPVIVDESGKFYGRFTMNKFHVQRTRLPDVVQFLNTCEGQTSDEVFDRIHQ